ncbi:MULTISPECIES: hypothetical protein [unclassified Nostoc]|nr:MULTISPECIES: hypothetical protein [unclassified Nostoc]MDM9585054.1 hypothetical protein [Nostoc sp. GT001]MDZ7946560.1 hypothetical protein [Nostoc sp. EfeVER01]MDZ7995973.1 hypothetical protein [Nostoc sp. EspVER01]
MTALIGSWLQRFSGDRLIAQFLAKYIFEPSQTKTPLHTVVF